MCPCGHACCASVRLAAHYVLFLRLPDPSGCATRHPKPSSSKTTVQQSARVALPPEALPLQMTSPKVIRRSRLVMPDQRCREEGRGGPPRIVLRCGFNTRPLFRCSLLLLGAVRLPVGRETDLDCLAENTAPRERGLLLKRHSQSAAFQAPADQAGTGAPPPAATLLPGLVMVYVSSSA